MKQSLTSTLVLLLLLALPVVGQENKTTMEEAEHYALAGAHSFHIGAGFPNKVGLGLSALGFIDNLAQSQLLEGGYTTPQVTLRYEYTLNEALGIGAHFGYWQAETPTVASNDILGGVLGGLDDLLGDFSDLLPNELESIEELLQEPILVRSFSVGGQITYHKQVLPKLDSYASAVLGYNFLSTKNAGDLIDQLNIDIPTIVYFTSVGVRYYFSPAIGIYGEVGYGNISNFNVGLTYRIP